MKRFKAKINKRKRIIKFMFIFFFFFAYVFMIQYLLDHKLERNILNKNVNYVSFNLNDLVNDKIDNTVNKPVMLLNNKVKNTYKVETKKTKVANKKEEIKASYENKMPILYIYNTHQSEKYANYSVYDASLYLSNELNKKGIFTYFEEQSVTTFLQNNNLKYYKSYLVSRKYMDEAINKYNSFKYFIDIHRDSVSKEKSTYFYNSKSYAKILFIVGLDNPNYKENLERATRLNNIIESKVPKISRGIMKKGGKGVNGLYNQDVSSDSFLIEIGSNNNSKEEVINTIKILEESIIEYIRGV